MCEAVEVAWDANRDADTVNTRRTFVTNARF